MRGLLRLFLALSLAAPSPAFAAVFRLAPAQTTVGTSSAAGAAPAAGGHGMESARTAVSLKPGVLLPSGISLTHPSPPSAAGVQAAADQPQAARGRSPLAPPPSRLDAAGPARPGQKTALESARAFAQAAAPAASGRAPAATGTGRISRKAAALFDGGRIFSAPNEDIGHEDIPTDLPAESEEVTREISENPEDEPLDLRFSRDALKKIKSSEINSSIRLVKGSGSQWYWEKFAENVPIRLLVGGRMSFFTRITQAETKSIGKLTRADFAGHYSKAYVYGKTRGGTFKYSLPQLRSRMIKDLIEFAKRTPNPPRVINAQTSVRVIHFMPYGEARHLPENEDEPPLEPRLRKPVEIPASLRDLRRMLPKLVLVDLRLFGEDGIPFELLEDMGKLMKAGMYFVFVSDKPQDGPGSVSEAIVKRLTLRQRDDVVRYKLFSLASNGNALYKYQGAFARPLPSRRFSPLELETLEFIARRRGAQEILNSRGFAFVAAPGRGMPAADFAAAIEQEAGNLRPDGTRFSVSIETQEGREVVVVRPTDIPGATANLLKVLQDSEGLYVNDSDVLVVTKDAGLAAAFPGAILPGKEAPDAGGAGLVDAAFAAMLGAYRENKPGDLAASASSISSFKYRPDGGGNFSYNIYMLLGHVMHSSFNWLIWVYRNTGVLPGYEEQLAKAMEIWRREDKERIKHLLETSGETLAGYLEAMEYRLRTMHQATARILKTYPIAVGTELPTLLVEPRYKKGAESRRDIFRGLYDFVAAREVEGGLEVAVVDFKSGQTPTMQTLAGDTQVQLYDVVSRKMWHSIAVPYGATGALKKVVKHVVAFIYPPSTYQPTLTEWSRIKFEKWLLNIMNRMRKHKAGPAPEKTEKKTPAKRKLSGPKAQR